MDLAALRAYCGSKKGTEETYPFDNVTLVMKVKGKMFALMSTDIPADEPQRITLKCDPQFAEILRQIYPAVQPGYHMDKRHWNTVTCDGSIPADELREMIDQSYDLVVKKLKKADREALLNA